MLVVDNVVVVSDEVVSVVTGGVVVKVVVVLEAQFVGVIAMSVRFSSRNLGLKCLYWLMSSRL